MRTGYSLKTLAELLDVPVNKAGGKADRAILAARTALATDPQGALATAIAAADAPDPGLLAFPWNTIGRLLRANFKVGMAMIAGAVVQIGEDVAAAVDQVTPQGAGRTSRRR